MERRRFGPTGSEIPVIGQGTWQIDESDRASVVAALRRGLDLGMNHIDTAEMYGDSEVIVGEAIDGRRDEVFLVSKVLPQNSSRTGTIAACERSLARLRTDRLDCYLLHWRGEHPLEDTFNAFEQLHAGQDPLLGREQLRRAGPRRSPGDRRRGAAHLQSSALSPGEGAIEHAVIPWCEAHGAAVVAYSPLGHGHFPGPNTKGGRVLREIAKRTARPCARLRYGSWCGAPRCSRSPRPPAPRTRPRTRGPATSG